MAFLKTRGGAVLVLIVVVVLSTMFGVNRSLGNMVREIEGECFAESKVQYNLDARIDSSMNLLTIALDYPVLKPETDSLRADRSALIDAWEESADTAQVALANRMLTRAADMLYSSMQSVALSETDAEEAAKDIKRMQEAARVLTQTEYNETAQEFNSKIMKVFPTNYLKYIGFVQEAALF